MTAVRRVVALAVGAGVALASAGCTQEEAAAPLEIPEVTASSPAAVEPPLAREVMTEEPARPRDARTPAGAARFGEYVVESLWYGVQQRDLALLWSLVQDESTCDSCARLEESVEAGVREGSRQLLTEPLEVRESVVLDQDQWVVGVGFVRPPIHEFDNAGKRVESYPASEQLVEMGLEWHGGRWTLYDYRYAED